MQDHCAQVVSTCKHELNLDDFDDNEDIARLSWDNMDFKERWRGSRESAIHFLQVGSDLAPPPSPHSQVWLKVMRKKDLLSSEWDLAVEEFEIHRAVSGLPHVIPVLSSERDDELIGIAMPRAAEGDLWGKIQYGGLTLSEYQAKHFASQIFSGLAQLHRAQVVHADVKPQNILLLPQGDKLSVALCDFGLSQRLPSESGAKVRFHEVRGTQGYIAPEVCAEQDYDEKIDIFAAALVLYRLVSGTEAFYPVENFTEDVEFADDCCGHLSAQCKHFLQSLLRLDPAQRLSAEEALQHSWLSEDLWEQNREAENELGLCFWHSMQVEWGLEDSVLAAEEPASIASATEKPRNTSKELSHSSSTSTICPESDDQVEGNAEQI
jgi:serine/threonine protein kinase